MGMMLSLLGWMVLPQLWLQYRAGHMVGAEQTKVERTFGPPFEVLTSSEAVSAALGWQPRPSRPISNKALIYIRANLGVIIYIDKNGKVEHVHKYGT
mgnify:CR=1